MRPLAPSCSVAGCEKPKKARGMCGMHTERVRRYGSTDKPKSKWPTTCSVDDCGRPFYALDMCQMHWRRARRGLPLDAPVRLVGVPFTERFERPESGCWEWTGSIRPDGYGQFNSQYAHRLSYELYVGPIPEGLSIDHLCRNRRCVRPSHLEPVTPRVNMLRGIAPAAVAIRTNRCLRGHEYTPENTYQRPDGAGRQCRICIKIRTSQATARRRMKAAS